MRKVLVLSIIFILVGLIGIALGTIYVPLIYQQSHSLTIGDKDVISYKLPASSGDEVIAKGFTSNPITILLISGIKVDGEWEVNGTFSVSSIAKFSHTYITLEGGNFPVNATFTVVVYNTSFRLPLISFSLFIEIIGIILLGYNIALARSKGYRSRKGKNKRL
ncbi:hypothetical protein [Acidianus sp. RZ1]|uniref:hypothetical protein n=1 Tax=Acidianus sp. RZ1 TaxID=1540082 RepID=UPI001491E37D|nr:hypothetical protein [Acidianus sp. RZ1]NON63295.1 hypothetical protein [Acidianus sp. RZ1]